MLSPLSTKPPIHAFTICDPFVVDWLHPQHPLGTTHTHTHMCAHTHILCSFTPHSPQLSIHPSSIQGLSFTHPFIHYPSTHPSIHTVIRPSIHPSIRPSTHPSLNQAW